MREFLTFSIIGAALLLSVIGLWFSAIIPGIDRWRRRFFTSYFIIVLLCCLSGIVETAFQYFIVPEAVFLFVLILETLQPIVENAVKHGMDLDSDPLHIYIRTRSTDSGAEIIVEDTGPGFDPSDESKPHIALKNIQQRLDMMCGGTMDIMPRDGGGTVVKLKIP